MSIAHSARSGSSWKRSHSWAQQDTFGSSRGRRKREAPQEYFIMDLRGPGLELMHSPQGSFSLDSPGALRTTRC